MSARMMSFLLESGVLPPSLPRVRIEAASISGLPGLAQARCAEVPVRPYALSDGTQVLPQLIGGGPAPEPISIINLIDHKARLKHEGVGDLGVVHWIGVLRDVQG